MAVRVSNSIRSGHRRKNLERLAEVNIGVSSEEADEMNLLTVASSNRGGYKSQSQNSRGDRHQSRESPTTDMLPPVRFNILGQMQMRKPPLSPEHSLSTGGTGVVGPVVKNSTPLGGDGRQINSGSGRNPSQSQACNNSDNKPPSQPPSSSSPLLSSKKNAGSDPESDSPLDFSTKKVKLDRSSNSPSSGASGYVDILSTEGTESESPCSRLRNILSMKSPVIHENLQGTILNLSKESSNSGWIIHKQHSDSRSGSSSSSPVHLDHHHHSAFIPSPPRNGIPNGMSVATGGIPPSGSPLSVSTNISVNPMSCSPYGVFSATSLSPVMNQTVPNVSLPLSFDTSPPMLGHHISASSASPNLPFGSGTLTSSGTGSSNKARATRPFKAYPKDPMSFSAAGLYGLPLGTTPGSTEAMIHQQSNVAYAEFRKQALTHAQAGRSRRGGQRGSNLSDSMMTSPGEPINYGMDTGAGSSAEDSHSAPEDGGKSTGAIKTEQQMKDEAYWERRRKNNEAAKRSRDARRAKEDEIAIRAAFLEQENLKLRYELSTLKQETYKLRCLLYSS